MASNCYKSQCILFLVSAVCLVSIVFFKCSSDRYFQGNLSLVYAFHHRIVKREYSYKSTERMLHNISINLNPIHQSDAQVRNKKQIVALMWTTFLGDSTWQNQLGLRTLSDNKICEFTSDKNCLPQADYVFFQSMSYKKIPPTRLPHNRWVFFNLEPPIATYKGWWLTTTFNYSSTYSSYSDFPQPYGKCLRSANGMNDNADYISEIITLKSALVAWFVTNCNTQSQRLQYANELKKYIQVDIYGGCGNLHCARFHKHCEDAINQKYKFYLSFENSLCKDYVTEKAFRPMISKYPMVPVVMGYANYSQILPPHSFIDVRWFKSPKDLAQYLQYLDKNNTEYAKYFEWRRNYRCGYFTVNFISFCERAHELYNYYSPFSHSVTKFSFNYECITPENFYRYTYQPSWLNIQSE